MQKILLSAGTDIGKRRKDNQDTYICQTLWSDDIALLAVIDGVGGYAGGDVAAAIAKDSILQYMSSPKGDTPTMLREAIVFANNQIFESKSSTGFWDMCCVLTVAIADVKAGRFYFAHVGDTRLYHFNGRILKKITKDHSLVGIREDAGDLTEEEAMNHPQRNIILRDAGSSIHRIDDTGFLDYGAHDFLPGEMLLLCSDGLSDMITSAQMINILIQSDQLTINVRDLIELANEMGGNDNISVVLAKNNNTPGVTQKKK